jgi:mitochondrial fission protein ELM1
MIIHKPLELERTGNLEADIITNLTKVTQLMESYISKYPAEYMWFYKIWKYSDEAHITILSDGKTGHLRQSQAVAKMTEKALSERKIKAITQVIEVQFKNLFSARLFSIISTISHPFFYQGRLEYLKWFLMKESFQHIVAIKTNFIISCGSSIAGVNNLLARDSNAKSIVILKPGLLHYNMFDLVVLPQHDEPKGKKYRNHFAITAAAPNLVTKEYLEQQSQELLNRFSHLKDNHKQKIGLLIGGDAKTVFISERQIKVLIRQIKEVLNEVSMDILITTSRRTPVRLEQILHKEFKKHPACPLLILANQENVSEAVGGILCLSDIIVVSGDSISMVSEAASSGKDTIVFLPQTRAKVLKGDNKCEAFIERLNAQGYILSSSLHNVGRSIYDIARNKIRTRPLNDNEIILDAVRKVI